MKNSIIKMQFTIMIIICVFLSAKSFAQFDTLDSELSYYPMNTGNYFEYIERRWELPFYDDSSFTSLSILSDTLLGNGLVYKTLLYKDILRDSMISTQFERIDSSDGSVYRYEFSSDLINNEYKIDSLFAQLGDTIRCSQTNLVDSEHYFTFVNNVYVDTVLGMPTEIKSFMDQSFIPGYAYELAKGFGFLSSFNCEFSCGTKKMVYAKVNGIEFGNKIVSYVKKENRIPKNLILFQNYPNPFNPTTRIRYSIPQSGNVNFYVYDILGKRVFNLVDEFKTKGEYELEFKADNLSNGIYFYIISIGEYSVTKKMILLK